MNDRELLELAAKAFGLKPSDGGPIVAHDTYGVWADGDTHWNPLTSPTDALDLAVRLRIGVDCYVDADLSEYCCAWINHRNVSSFYRSYEPYAQDPVAATCRAIVRTAAEVGKAQDGR